MDEVGGCRLTGVAGSGGFAVTYVGEHPDAGAVAVKVLSANWANDINVAARFEAECEKLAAATTLIGESRYAVPRHIAHGIEPGPGGDRPYLVTELCRGGSLAQRLPLLRDLPLDQRIGHAAWVITEAAAAMAVVHDRLGVVHRDLSPGNLLFRRHPAADPSRTGQGSAGTEELVVGDFGLMKEAALQSNFSRVLGTGAYAAPEVRTQGLCDHRSDVYSLGVIAWELITGRTPDHDQPLEPLDRFDPAVPAPVVELVSAATADQREHRPDLAHVVATLAPYATTPPPAPPDGQITTPLPAEPGRRRRWLAVAAAVLTTLVVAGGVLAWRLTPGDDGLTTYTPANGGFTIDLDDQWSEIDTDPDVAGILLSGFNLPREMVFTVGATGAATVADAVTVASAVVEAGQDGGEVISSQALADDRAKLVYRAGAFNYVAYFAARSCGTLTLQFTASGDLTDDTLAYLDEVAGSFELADEITVEGTDGELPSGLAWFEGSGVRLAGPETFIKSTPGSNCLQMADMTPGRNRSVSITYAPAVTAADKAAADEVSLVSSGNELLDGSPAPDGTLRRHFRSAAQRTEARYYYLPASSGVFVVMALEMAGEPWDQAWLDQLDVIAATLEVLDQG